MLRRLPWRTFLTAFILTSCVLGLFAAFLIIEYNIQKTTYGQVDLGVTYTVEDGLPSVRIGESTPLTLSPAVEQTAEVVAPPPARLFAILWRWENELAEWVWTIINH